MGVVCVEELKPTEEEANIFPHTPFFFIAVDAGGAYCIPTTAYFCSHLP
jgi:hypothetical protein